MQNTWETTYQSLHGEKSEKKRAKQKKTEQRLEAMEKIRYFKAASGHKISDDDTRGTSKNMWSQCPRLSVK